MEKLKKMPKRHPMDGTFELTVRCNLHCKMCLFRHDDSENAGIMKKELSAEQWIDMAEQVAKAGTVSMLITGGEPMLRSDFCEIYEGIYKQGFILTLYTNATLVTPEIMEVLRKYPPHKIGVTIYGASPETYEKVCKDAGAFEKALSGMRKLHTLPSLMEFRTTLIKDNVADIDAMEQLIQKEFGKECILTQTRTVTKPVRGACGNVEECRLEPEDNVRLAFRRGMNIIKEYVGETYDEKNVYLERKSSEEESGQKQLSLLGCHAGMSSYTISWDGQLLGCQMLGAFSTDALKNGFEKAWEMYPFEVKIPEMNETCRKCKIYDMCQCCYASRYAETGSLAGCPEYVCQDTQIVKKLLENGGIGYEYSS